MTRQRVTENGSKSLRSILVRPRTALRTARSARSRSRLSVRARLRDFFLDLCATLLSVISTFVIQNPLPAFAVTRARRFSFGGTPAQLVADEIAVHADEDLALAPSSICSSARTGTRNNRPILITGSS